MGADGSQGPKPFTQREAKTIFLRVPFVDWPMVTNGDKTEFRAGSGSVSGLKFVEPPLPVVAYTYHPVQGYQAKLMILEERRQEPLAAITGESLEREGFESFEEFRSYWCARERRRFTPTRQIVVYRVRLFEKGDEELFADRLFEHLYGAFQPASETKTPSYFG